MIAGEIKRYLRDDGILKGGRKLKENGFRICQAREKLEKKLSREPTLEEISVEVELSMDELVLSMDAAAEVESLHKIIYQGEGNELSLIDKLPEKENGQEQALEKIFLNEMLGKLEERERQLIRMRYFQDHTQTEIPEELGISQVQVSRLEKRILRELREKLLA